jgi:adenosylmethionine-8-amino-7-oxononanoate aminotransferase
MNSVRHSEFVVTRADDVWVWDDSDRRYLDATASLWYVNAGHGRTKIVDAVTKQMRQLACYQTFNDFANPPALELAERLSSLAPAPSRVYLASGGGDAIDTAAKIARQYFVQTGRPEKTVLLSRDWSYHGTHGFGTSLAGQPANRLGAPLHPDIDIVSPHNDASALEATIQRIGADRVAAFFCEPVIGSGGVRPPAPGYIEAVAEICARHDVLFVADVVICGFGRLGGWFGVERFGVKPDLITFAKGVTSGYQPLGGVMVQDRIAAPFWDDPKAPALRHGATYAGHPAACAAALANLDVLEEDGLLARADVLEGQILDGLSTLADHPLITEVRGGTGALGAVELDAERLAADPTLPMRASVAIRDRGVIVRPTPTAIACSPPLTATQEHIDLLVSTMREGLDEMV